MIILLLPGAPALWRRTDIAYDEVCLELLILKPLVGS